MVSRKLLTNIRSHTIGILDYLMAVLTAIAIPVFTSQLEKSREATDMSNLRAAYAEAMATYMTDNKTASATVSAKQQQTGWQNSGNGSLFTRINGEESAVNVSAKTNGQTWTVHVNSTSTSPYVSVYVD